MNDLRQDLEIFLFINNASGSGVGTQLSQLKGPMKFVIPIPQSYRTEKVKFQQNVNVHFFTMKVNKDQGFTLLKSYTQTDRKCFGIICGGDGTVTWVISQLHKNNINSRKIPFGIVPLGTGNDFSQNLGWGATTSDLIDNDFRKLKKKILKIITADQQDLDIWHVIAQSFSYGKIQKYESEEHKNLGTKLDKPFVNYFSFGLDGKVGYSFDKHRTQSRLGNLTVYGLLGLIKGATKTKNVNELLQSFSERKSMVENGKLNLLQNQETIFASTKRGLQSKAVYEYNQNILALNINSFMGGAKDIWKNAEPADKLNKQPQSSSDGKLQFVSFPGSLSIGMQKTFGGFAHRVHQGSGPFNFTFKDYDQNQKHRTYLQIDGQFFRFNHPKEIIIQKSELLSGKFRVLRCKKVISQNIGCCGKGCFG